MTIDEAIRHCEEVMVENLEKTKDRNASDPIAINCFECADEHRQLAEWLKELKAYKEQSGDAISRQAALDLAKDLTFEGGCKHRCVDVLDIEELPPVTPPQKPIDKSAMMYEIYMNGVNMSGEYQGCWVRFKDIEKIVDEYMAESEAKS